MTVIIDDKAVTSHLANSSENHRKYHCSYSDMLEWGTSVKSDWLSVIRSCGLCLLITWICWLHWSNHQLSKDVLKLKNEFSFSSRVSGYQLEKDLNSQVKNTQPDISKSLEVQHLVYKHSARRRRRQRDQRIQAEIYDYMKKNTYALFLPGTNEITEKGYFKWNLTFAGTQDVFIASHSNGTFTFKKEGFYLIASQVTVRGKDGLQNYGVSYGYKTVLVKDNHDDEILMLSEITQDNRGTCYRAKDSQHCAIDSISHMVMRHFEKDDQIAIKKYTNGYSVNYYLTGRNSYFSIVALDLWNV